MLTTKTTEAGIRIGSLEGRLDTVTAPKAEPALLALASGGDAVLDMSAVRFVSSAGLRVLLKAAKASKAGGHRFAICAMQPSVREVYEIGGFDRIIAAHATRDEAVAAFG